MDRELRTALWNEMYKAFWVNLDNTVDYDFVEIASDLIQKTIEEFFKFALDSMSPSPKERLRVIGREYQTMKWFRVYDLLEFLAENDYSKEFPARCNAALKREWSGYRFIGARIVPITDASQLNEVQAALDESPDPVAEHLHTAVERLSDRESPDYRNSVKESISAVEAMCNALLPERKTFGAALKELGTVGVVINPVLRMAFDKLYGYTSDADGIRHALVDDASVGQEEALFFLVACSAFVNYLRGKAGQRARGIANQHREGD